MAALKSNYVQLQRWLVDNDGLDALLDYILYQIEEIKRPSLEEHQIICKSNKRKYD